MSKQIYFKKDELELLDYILIMYKSLHEDGWKEGVCKGDKPLVENMIKKVSHKI